MQPAQHLTGSTSKSQARTPRPVAAFVAALTTAAVLGASACTDAPTAPSTQTVAGPSTSLGLPDAATADTLKAGETVQLTATLRTGRSSTAPVWTSSNADAATVSSAGLVTAVGAGSATISASNGSSSSSVTIVVVPTPALVAQPSSGDPVAARVLAFMGAANLPSVAAVQARGGAYAKYETEFAKFADYHWTLVYQGYDSTSFGSNFYDRASIYYVWWARTGNPAYLDRANKLALGARAYLEGKNYYPQTYEMMLDGVALHALVTGDPRSAATVAKTADAIGASNSWFAYVAGNPGDGNNDGRNSAKVLTAVLDAYLLKVASPAGLDYAARLRDLETRILSTQWADGGYHWPNQCGHNKPFMNGMLNDALIRYHTSFEADTRIVQSVKAAVDYMWTNDWFPASSAFTYLEGYCASTGESGGAPGAADLNNLISSGYAFVAKQTGDPAYATKADAVFAGGVNGTWLYGPKQFNQEYATSYLYLALRF